MGQNNSELLEQLKTRIKNVNKSSFTTPDTYELNKIISKMCEKIENIFMEVSSHALHQNEYRTLILIQRFFLISHKTI